MVTVTRASHIPAAVAFVALAYWSRELISPSLQMGRMSGTIAALNSRYRSAHHNLVQHGEAIVFAGGSQPEAARIKGIFGELMATWKRLMWLQTQSSVAHSLLQPMGGGGLIGIQNLLVHLPFLLPNNPLRAPVGASTEQVMRANAAMLGQISMERQVLMMFLHRIEEMCQLPRQILSGSGSLSRVVALLNAIDPSNFDIVPNEQNGDTISFTNVNIDTPTGPVFPLFSVIFNRKMPFFRAF